MIMCSSAATRAGGDDDPRRHVVVVEGLAPAVSAAAVEAALRQFGDVRAVELVKNPVDPKQQLGIGRALVTMGSAADADNVVTHLHKFLVMIGGTPRPVTAVHGSGHFSCKQQPRRGRETEMRVVRSPELAQLKRLHDKHKREMDTLCKLHAEAEEALAEAQGKQMSSYFKMLHSLENEDASVAKLKSMYHVQDDV
ncbi:uncharacterized protein LOC112351307 [Selaginella moellendorffii]|uniref:uncharacterized protein LOC112351307 n=1 Tax=Selaginella moellendorffii TaxID=88036 RepID=UPI000D1C8AA8|nr:uncharacterized protein LOC112351307 [Selaginella moellendorffii]|eukprot:XP_024544694.1 uncharacterized protein LOC112351307 [Selaginella moellendorffii]